MTFTTPLISAQALRSLISQGQRLVVLDCSFDLADAQAGERAYAAAHLPGAHYAHLERDLSGASTDAGGLSLGRGRHPLPERSTLAAAAGRWGIAPGVPVVTLDAQGGPYAARAWWLLRWLGHAEVAVLDGGLAAWQAAGGDLTDRASSTADANTDASPYPSLPPAMPTVDATALRAGLGLGEDQGMGAHPSGLRLLDARAPERFRGEVEPLDPVAGHIPGASNRLFKLNLQADGRFKPAKQLRAEFEALLEQGGPGDERAEHAAEAEAQRWVHQCGSGVTACHNLLAMTHAGLPGSLLYPGSWSEWCADPARPVARGPSTAAAGPQASPGA